MILSAYRAAAASAYTSDAKGGKRASINTLLLNLLSDIHHMSQFPANSFFLEYRPADSIDAVYALEVECFGEAYEAEDFQKIIEVPSDLSLIKLHVLMQHVIGMDEGKIDAFYLAASLRGVKTWYKRNSTWVPENQSALNLSIGEILPPHSNRKLFYLRGSRMFRISKISAGDTPLPDRKYPRIVRWASPI